MIGAMGGSNGVLRTLKNVGRFMLPFALIQIVCLSVSKKEDEKS